MNKSFVELPASSDGVALGCCWLTAGNIEAPVAAGFGANGDGARPEPTFACWGFDASAACNTEFDAELAAGAGLKFKASDNGCCDLSPVEAGVSPSGFAGPVADGNIVELGAPVGGNIF